MFKGLQARLTLSYVAIILICLVLVGLAALVLLRGYETNLIFSRLADRSILVTRLMVESLRQGSAPQEAIDRLTQQVNRRDGPVTSLYLLDSQGRVVAGSDDRLDNQKFEELVVRPQSPSDWRVRGERRLEGGERILYVASLVRAQVDEEQRMTPYVLILAERTRILRTAVGGLLPRLVWAGLVALFLSVAVAAVMAYSIARPLDRIAQAAEEIASGHYDQELDISSPAEVARLAASFNSMARQVKTTMQSQQDLIANVSHDLKTPLTSIQGFSQALLDGTASDDAARERAAAIIHEEASRMRRLVEDLLDLARLEAGQVALAREPVDVGRLLHACAARFAPQAKRADVTLEVQVPAVLPQVLGDGDRLGQVFGNLVDNALKHAGSSTDEGRVILQVEPRDHSVVCSVTDNGAGIPAEDLARIFERFYQVDKARTRRTSGAGLGLAIAQEIVQAHGGQIWAESVQGLGTRFTVELPAQPS